MVINAQQRYIFFFFQSIKAISLIHTIHILLISSTWSRDLFALKDNAIKSYLRGQIKSLNSMRLEYVDLT